MNKDQRAYIVPTTANHVVNHWNTNSNLSNFEYKAPNNTGVVLGIIGGALTTVGDVLATIGAIIQLNIDVSDDFQSQIGDFKADQEKEKMQEEIDDLKEKVKQLEQLIKSNEN